MAFNPIIIRIDDRLIHGQVLVGWMSSYPIRHLIVCNNHIAENEWEKNLLLMAAPSNFDTRVLSLDDTLLYIHQHLETLDISMILLNSPYDMKILADRGLTIKQINIGGIHFDEGRTEYLPYLFLDTEEVRIFRELIKKGFVFECQDVPNSAKYDLAKILEKKS